MGEITGHPCRRSVQHLLYQRGRLSRGRSSWNESLSVNVVLCVQSHLVNRTLSSSATAPTVSAEPGRSSVVVLSTRNRRFALKVQAISIPETAKKGENFSFTSVPIAAPRCTQTQTAGPTTAGLRWVRSLIPPFRLRRSRFGSARCTRGSTYLLGWRTFSKTGRPSPRPSKLGRSARDAEGSACAAVSGV